MKAIGKIKIEEGLVLNNPKMEIIDIHYPQSTNNVVVDLYFIEENSTGKHSRTYIFNNENGADLGYADVLAMVKSHDILCLFK